MSHIIKLLKFFTDVNFFKSFSINMNDGNELVLKYTLSHTVSDSKHCSIVIGERSLHMIPIATGERNTQVS